MLLMLGAVLGVALIAGVVYFYSPTQSPKAEAPENPKGIEVSQDIQYINEVYGFKINLPPAWKGFEVYYETWTAKEVSGVMATSGPKIVVRHPKWTEDHPYQDISILVLSPLTYDGIVNGDYAVGAAPVPPQRLGANSKYVFALPARWIGFTDALGVDELMKWGVEKNFKVL